MAFVILKRENYFSDSFCGIFLFHILIWLSFNPNLPKPNRFLEWLKGLVKIFKDIISVGEAVLDLTSDDIVKDFLPFQVIFIVMGSSSKQSHIIDYIMRSKFV